MSFQPIHASQTEVRSSLLTADTLYSYLLSLVSLSGLSLTHTYHSIYIYVYICLIATENRSVSTCVARSPCNTIIFIPLTDCSLSIRVQTHSHSADHSLIPQAHAIMPLQLSCEILYAQGYSKSSKLHWIVLSPIVSVPVPLISLHPN